MQLDEVVALLLKLLPDLPGTVVNLQAPAKLVAHHHALRRCRHNGRRHRRGQELAEVDRRAGGRDIETAELVVHHARGHIDRRQRVAGGAEPNRHDVCSVLANLERSRVRLALNQPGHAVHTRDPLRRGLFTLRDGEIRIDDPLGWPLRIDRVHERAGIVFCLEAGDPRRHEREAETHVDRLAAVIELAQPAGDLVGRRLVQFAHRRLGHPVADAVQLVHARLLEALQVAKRLPVGQPRRAGHQANGALVTNGVETRDRRRHRGVVNILVDEAKRLERDDFEDNVVAQDDGPQGIATLAWQAHRNDAGLAIADLVSVAPARKIGQQIERLRGPIRIGEQVDTGLDQREDVALDPGTILQQDEVDRVCLQPAMRVELAADRRPGAFSRLGDPRRSRFEIEIPASHHLEAGFRKVLYRQRDGGKVERRLGFLRPRQRTWRRDASGHRNKAKNQDQSRQPDHARSPLSGTASTAVPIPRRQASTVIPAAISPKLSQ